MRTKKRSEPTALFMVGASPAAVREMGSVINDILYADVDQSTMVVALETLRQGCAVNNTTINNCSFKYNPGE